MVPLIHQHDVHSPGWIPLLNSGSTTPVVHKETESEKELSPYSTSAFSPTESTAPATVPPKSALRHTLSKASQAPVPTISETEVLRPKPPPIPETPNTLTIELAATRPPSMHFERRRKKQASEEGHESTNDTNGTTASINTASVGTGSVLGDQAYASPRSPSAEDAPQSNLPLSASSSLRSIQHVPSPAVPTSKFSRKPIPSSSRVHSATPSINEAPVLSPDTSQSEFPDIQRPELPPRVDSMPSPPTSSTLYASKSTKSTASTSRKRALHSHPSNQSIKSRPASPSNLDAVATTPLPPSKSPSRSTSGRRARKASDPLLTVRTSVHDLQSPSPAPTTPLPQLPVHARPQINITAAPSIYSPSTSQTLSGTPEVPSRLEAPPKAYLPPSSSNSPAVGSTSPTSAATVTSLTANPESTLSQQVSQPILPQPPQPVATANPTHSALSSFMTTTSTLIFRRFDDVHVQLLLHLQDEIAQLERDLQELDSATMKQGEREVKRMKTLRELRGLVGEYGKTFHPVLVGWHTNVSCSRRHVQQLEPDEKHQGHNLHHGGSEAMAAASWNQCRCRLEWRHATEPQVARSIRGEGGPECPSSRNWREKIG